MSGEPVDQSRYTEDYYLEACGGAEFFKLYGPKVVKPAQAYALKRAALRPGLTALDAGCGRGEILYQLRQRDIAALGADYAQAALPVARRVSNAPVARCDAKKLPFKDKSFDRIFFLGVLDHMHDWELEACFAEFKRTLRPGGFVLANTCANTEYLKNLTYDARKALARTLGLKVPRPPRTSQDEVLHVNEHSEGALRRFFEKIGWKGEVEPRPNDKYTLKELYGDELPEGFPIKPLPAWRRGGMNLAFRGPWKRFLAREFFCVVAPR